MAMQTFEGCEAFRQRIVCATLSGKPCRFRNIRTLDDSPGIQQHEASFLRLVDKISNGSRVSINETGTVVTYHPGLLKGGRRLKHDCGTERSIGYFLEFLMCLAPFCKKPLHITLTGITNKEEDPSVDIIRTVLLPVLQRFGVEDGLELKVTKRGSAPGGGGEVVFQCPNVRSVNPVRILDMGRIKRIRGIVYTTRVAPQTANRVVDVCRGKLNALLPDVYIYTDHYTGAESGLSPGFGVSLVAESTTAALHSSEGIAAQGELPEDVGKRTTRLLLEEIFRGGCIDSASQSLCFLFMCLGPEDVSKVLVGKLTPFSMQMLRDIKQFFGVTFKIRPDAETKMVTLSCVGVGHINLNKKIG